MFDWLPIISLHARRTVRWGTGNRCNGKLICYRVCLISLFPAFILSFFFFFFNFSFFILLRSSSFPSRSHLLNCSNPLLEYFILSQTKSTCAWLESPLSRVYTFFFFSVTPSALTDQPTSRALRGDAVPFCSLHVFSFLFFLRVSVWLMVWNIERCLFLLWLARQGAQWQTTRDQIDYAASLWSRP